MDRLADAAARCDLSDARPALSKAVRRLRGAGMLLSDRRAIRAQSLIAAAATVDGRSRAGDADLWALPLIAPTADTQVLAQEVLRDLLGDAGNASLVHSAAELANGRRARAERLTRNGLDLLGEPPRHTRR